MKVDKRREINFKAIWLKGLYQNIDLDIIIDSGASAHNVIPLEMAEKMGLKPIFKGNKVTTIGNEEVRISAPMELTITINGFEITQNFVVIDTKINFIILGMPWVATLTSVNFKNKTIYAGKARFPFTTNRNDPDHLHKRQKAALVIYALNETQYAKPIKIYDVNNEKKQQMANEEHLVKFRETIADKLDHIADKHHSTLLFDAIIENHGAFSLFKGDLGLFKGPIVGKLYLTDETPIFENLRPQPYGYRDILQKHEETMLELGVVEEGNSDFRFNMVLAPKKSHGQKNLDPKDLLRACTDYRKLNRRLRNDPFPIPNMQEILDQMTGMKYFSQFDLTSGYWHIPMDPESKKYTAFVAQSGKTLVYNRLSFGIATAPQIFCRAMAWTIDPLRKYGIYAYMDDIIVATKTIEEHILALRMLFKRMEETGWKIHPGKSSFLQESVKFLGFIVSEEGLKPDPERVEIYRNWERPKNARQLIAFLQSLQYYKRFIHRFALIAAPLYDLTKKDRKFEWENDHEKAFNTLKEKIVNHVNLQYAQVDKPYRLTTDWQPVAVSYVLEQMDGSGIWQPISLGGRKLSKADSTLSSYEGELVAGYVAFRALEKYL